MKKKFLLLIVILAGTYAFVYLIVHETGEKSFLTDVVNISATVPPAIVAIEETPVQQTATSGGGGGGSLPITTKKIEPKPTPSSTNTEPVPATQPIIPVIPTDNNQHPEVIVVKPVPEKNVVIQKNDQITLDQKTMELFVKPEIITPYLVPIMPEITRNDLILRNILTLDVDKILPNEKIDLYANNPIIFTGKTVPFAKLEIKLFSMTQKDTIFADKDGQWIWSPPKPVGIENDELDLIIRAQATDQVIDTKSIALDVKAPKSENVNDNPLYISLTPGYQVVSPEKSFTVEINLYKYDQKIQYPLKVDYWIFNNDGALYGKGSASADPADGSIVRMPIQLNSDVKAGIYRLHVTTTVLGKEIDDDEVFKDLENKESKIIQSNLQTTEKNKDWMTFEIFVATVLVGGGIYFFIKIK